MKRVFLVLIHFYQVFISPFLGPRCRFHPTCSEYAKECFTRFSLPRALWYSTIRLLRCHPFHPGGFDPVKEDCCS